MPFFTPDMMMTWVMPMKRAVHKMGRKTPEENVSNSAVNAAADFPASEPMQACMMYSSVQPETTE